MAIPNHRADCQTKTYPVECRGCGRSIYILQCTCGSMVLLEENKPLWEKHECHGGIGGSGYSGWEAADILRARGYPIMPWIVRRVFSQKAPSKERQKVVQEDIGIARPVRGARLSFLALVSDLHPQTKRTERMKILGGIGTKIFGLPPGPFGQVTLINNGAHPNLSYTCILPERLGLPKNAKGKIVFAQIETRGTGGHLVWAVTDIRVI